jgi:LysM repeat protein
VWLAATVGAAATLAWLAPDLLVAPDALAAERFDAVLVVVCEAAAGLGVGWLWLLVTLVTLDAVRGVQRHRTGIPSSVRRAVLVACGLGLAGGIGGAAYAEPPDRAGAAGVRAESVLAGLQLPDRTTTTRRGVPPATQAVEDSAEPRTIVVVAGDTLWDLAAAELPPGADAARVAAHWRAIHNANRAVIGPDPDLIRPGQRLRLPPVPAPRTDA